MNSFFIQIFTTEINALCIYIEQNWMRTVGANKMSVFGLQHGIFNDIQVFNKDLNTSLGTSSPTIWHMLGNYCSFY